MLLLLMVTVAAIFWLGSRIPALNAKSLTGGDTRLDAIGFDILITAKEGASILERVFVSSINWMYTNWRGMAFGLLFGTLLMSLLSLIRDMQFNNPYANALAGLLIGAPLGVCANCAAPIAKGMLMAGSRPETALAALLSSPTLNVIVISMAVALLPLHLVLLKVAFSLFAILMLVPLVCRFAPISLTEANPKAPIEVADYQEDRDQRSLIATLAHLIFKNGLSLCVRTVPLMILAGFLGGAAVTLLPLDQLSSVLPASGAKQVILILPFLALFGLFLPVPIAFDVIVTAILLQAGLHPAYAAVLLLTLGIFSIYPYTLLATNGAEKTARYLSIGLLAMAVAAGVFAYEYDRHQQIGQEESRRNFVASQKIPIPMPVYSVRQPGELWESLSPKISKNARQWDLVKSQDALTIARKPFIVGIEASSKPNLISGPIIFEVADGRKYGIEEPLNYLPIKLSLRMSEFRAVASGDIHGDGWPDLVFSSHDGIGLYANDGGKGFIAQNVDIGLPKQSYIGSVALIDINNDGLLDLVVSTLDDGVFIAANQDGSFSKTATIRMRNTKGKSVANAMAFADVDRNGEIDIFLGNVGRHIKRRGVSYPEAQNLLLLQKNGEFHRRLLPEVPAETLSVLISDIAENSLPDIFVGNDFDPADEIYVNRGNGDFDRTGGSQKITPYGGLTTMSIASADINNDLIPEIFLAQKNMTNAIREMPPEKLCQFISNSTERAICVEHRLLTLVRTAAVRERDMTICDQVEGTRLRFGCYAVLIRELAAINNAPEQCDIIANSWPILARECASFFSPAAAPERSLLADQMASENGRNILYQRNSNGQYEDVAEGFNLTDTGWAWNAKFADLDNDGWQDLFVATGDAFVDNYHPFFLYRNQNGKSFADVAKSAGFRSLRSFLGYSYLDMDGDGDLDIVAIPGLGNPQIFINHSPKSNAIQFELSDKIGNSDGIGSQIIVEYGGKHQIRELLASGGYLSFDPAVAHFGLANIQQIDRVKIIWSTGETQVISGPFPTGFAYRISREEK